MNIKLLGTGSAEGWPGLFCTCRVCQESKILRGKNIRSRASAIIDGTLKIDLPPDTYYHVVTQQLDMSAVELLAFTHAHDDHLAPAEFQYASSYFVPEESTTPLRVVGCSTVIQKIRNGVDIEDLPFCLEQMDAWKNYHYGKWQITPIMANHDPTQVCFNLIISDGVKTLLYATDTGWYHGETWEFLSNFRLDGAVIEISRGPKEEGYSGHMSIPEVIRMREKLIGYGALSQSSPVVTTHHSHLGGLLHDEMEEILNPHNIQVGYDGMVFDL